jgi:Ca-activated chloride channel family protein
MTADQQVLAIAFVAAALTFALRALSVRRAKRERDRLADVAILRQFVRIPSARWAWVRACLTAAGVGLLAGVAAGAGGKAPEPEEPDEEGAETVLVLDASNSMLAEDVEPSRLQVQRELARQLAVRLPGNIAVVYFAGRGYVLSPLTSDLSAVRMFVDAVRPASVGRGGSSLAAGLTQALDLLAGGVDEARKTIVLFSDGEETVEQSTGEAIERARDAGIEVHVIGIGTLEGGPIPLSRDASVDPATSFERRRGESFLRGPDGEVVVTQLEAATLESIAAATGGVYLPADGESIARVVERVSETAAPGEETGQGLIGIMLLLGFGLLWGEAFLFMRG